MNQQTPSADKGAPSARSHRKLARWKRSVAAAWVLVCLTVVAWIATIWCRPQIDVELDKLPNDDSRVVLLLYDGRIDLTAASTLRGRSVKSISISAEPSAIMGSGLTWSEILIHYPSFLGFGLPRCGRSWLDGFTYVDLPLWVLMIALLVLVVVGRMRVRSLSASVRRCAQCGYCLIGNLSGRCPECGTPIRIAESAQSSERALTERRSRPVE